jgi:outer membrane protein assembly factor BamB/dienelactone hydrolase
MTANRTTLASLGAFAALLVACVAAVADDRPSARATAFDPADWPMYNHDLAGWRFNPAEKTLSPANVGKLVEKWRFPATGSNETIGVVHATPSVVAGEVYFGTATFPAFYKLAPDGRQRWVYRNPARQAVLPPADGAPVTEKLRAAASGAGIFSSALVASGSVYFADTAGWMYCLDASTGDERWKIDTRAATFPGAHFNNLLMASPIMADGKVVFAGGTLEQLFAGTFAYAGSTGRGFLVAVEPETGRIVWKHDVGPKPEKLDPPIVVESSWGKHKFEHGPATSSVWSTPSYDPESNTLYFGTDVNTAPRKPTPDNPDLHTPDSCAIVALDAATGARKWNTQVNPGDMWTNAMRAYDPKTGLYKDGSIGDTPKIFTIALDGTDTKVVGAGCKNGGFYLLRADDGKLIRHTPLYTGPPTHPPEAHDPRVLALPSPIGGLQSGCATDGRTIFTNGIDAIRLATQASPLASGQVPTGGRVTATSVDLATERWRHERPKIPEMGGTPGKPMYRDVGDIVGSGIAVGNGVAYFTAVGSGKLIALDAVTGSVLKEMELGPVFAGPSLSRGRVYVGGGNTLWTPSEFECFFPKQYTGSVRCFALANTDLAAAEDDVSIRTENIISEGTRMAADVYAPKNPGSDKLPTIVMSHGWGGTAAALRPDAIVFARAGYLVVAFDYRGWGKSDSRLVPAGGKPESKDGKLISEVKEVREVVDPIDQTTDILNAIHWAAGDKQCDPERIGIWGSSFSGGHVVYVAARDPRVKAFVSQVGSMDGRWVLGPQLKAYTLSQASARTRGQIGYPKPGEKFGTLTGAPVIEKFIGYAPIEDIGRCEKCAKLFMIAENEELFDNKEHAILAHQRATGVKKLITIRGIKHYGVYNEARDRAQKEAIAWFDEHLK